MREYAIPLGWLVGGLVFFAAMAVHDKAHGRPIQHRDWHVLVWWPLLLPVILVLGVMEFSRITSEDNK